MVYQSGVELIITNIIINNNNYNNNIITNIHLANLEVTISTLIKKPMSYPTINLYKDFNVLNLKAIYYKNIILNMYKVYHI